MPVPRASNPNIGKNPVPAASKPAEDVKAQAGAPVAPSSAGSIGATADSFVKENQAIADAQMKSSTAMAKQTAIAAMNDALNKTINNVGKSMKDAVG
jgi:hypothetical protein